MLQLKIPHLEKNLTSFLEEVPLGLRVLCQSLPEVVLAQAE